MKPNLPRPGGRGPETQASPDCRWGEPVAGIMATTRPHGASDAPCPCTEALWRDFRAAPIRQRGPGRETRHSAPVNGFDDLPPPGIRRGQAGGRPPGVTEGWAADAHRAPRTRFSLRPHQTHGGGGERGSEGLCSRPGGVRGRWRGLRAASLCPRRRPRTADGRRRRAPQDGPDSAGDADSRRTPARPRRSHTGTDGSGRP